MTALSPGNARVKQARKLSRRSERSERRLFLAEGEKALAEALSVPGCVVEVFATADATARLRARYDDPSLTWSVVTDPALDSLADTVTPQGVVAVCRSVDRPLDDVLGSLGDARLVALCADVRDPGNAGTVVRCADAAGADAVVLCGHSVDAGNPKTVRATVGSLFHLPVATEPDAAAAVAALQRAGLQVLAADGAGETDLDEAADDELLAAPTAWLFGNEAWGLPVELAALADRRVRIPIHGRAESLNLSTAAAVCLYASARAHRP
ncbi:RNA methyltransferase [Marmoricola endophyticus]|uniref:RNA methyltransferase n=1 Tax=Marmoricola endophyticus TaxID=2040280 RepID=A0A917F0A0_9ACTN|nr:RNA methyltransferase [Marmoricola endophyticus]GGF35564.1 RNA methyltransferase [Marmoricola endophyticus]